MAETLNAVCGDFSHLPTVGQRVNENGVNEKAKFMVTTAVSYGGFGRIFGCTRKSCGKLSGPRGQNCCTKVGMNVQRVGSDMCYLSIKR